MKVWDVLGLTGRMVVMLPSSTLQVDSWIWVMFDVIRIRLPPTGS